MSIDIKSLASDLSHNRLNYKKIQPPFEQNLYESFQKLNIVDLELQTVMSEILSNALEHGSSELDLYLEKVDQNIIFCIWDKGTGIHNTIPVNKNLSDTKGKSASSILRLSLEEGITGTGTIGRGYGLFLLSDYCSKNNSQALLMSDGGLLIQNDTKYYQENLKTSIQGTIICLKTKAL